MRSEGLCILTRLVLQKYTFSRLFYNLGDINGFQTESTLHIFIE